MRSASEKTIRGSRSTRMLYAKRAIDRAVDAGCYDGGNISLAEWVSAGILKEFWPIIKPEDMLEWALKERDHLVAHKVHVDLVCFCGTPYTARTKDVEKGWGASCSKRCAKKLYTKEKVL